MSQEYMKTTSKTMHIHCNMCRNLTETFQQIAIVHRKAQKARVAQKMEIVLANQVLQEKNVLVLVSQMGLKVAMRIPKHATAKKTSRGRVVTSAMTVIMEMIVKV